LGPLQAGVKSKVGSLLRHEVHVLTQFRNVLVGGPAHLVQLVQDSRVNLTLLIQVKQRTVLVSGTLDFFLLPVRSLPGRIVLGHLTQLVHNARLAPVVLHTGPQAIEVAVLDFPKFAADTLQSLSELIPRREVRVTRKPLHKRVDTDKRCTDKPSTSSALTEAASGTTAVLPDLAGALSSLAS